MGQKATGGMWCPTCNKPVTSTCNTHRVRNAVSLWGFLTGGAFTMWLFKRERDICPVCGGATVKDGRFNRAFASRFKFLYKPQRTQK